MLSQLVKLDKLYIISTSTKLLQRSKHDFISYNNQIFPNNSHINLRTCDDVSSYHYPSPITGSNIQKWDRIFDCFSGCQRMNAPYLESSDKLDSLFPVSLNKIRFHIFQRISIFSIYE